MPATTRVAKAGLTAPQPLPAAPAVPPAPSGPALVERVRSGFHPHLARTLSPRTASAHRKAVQRYLDWLGQKHASLIEHIDADQLLQKADLYLFVLGPHAPDYRPFRAALGALREFVAGK